MKASPILHHLGTTAMKAEDAQRDVERAAAALQQSAEDLVERVAKGGSAIDFVSSQAKRVADTLQARTDAFAALKAALYLAKKTECVFVREGGPQEADYLYLHADLLDDEVARKAYSLCTGIGREGLRLVELEVVPLVSLDAKRP